MRHPRIRRELLAIGPAFVVLLLGVVAYDGVRRADASRALVQHTRDVIDRAHATLSTLQDAETGQRGYLITGESRYLEPYERALVSLRIHTDTLRRLTRDNASQQRRLDSLALRVQDKLEELAETIDRRRSRGFDAAAATVRSDRGRQAMEASRSLLAAVIAEEETLLGRRQLAEARHDRLVTVILIAGTLAAVLFALGLTAMLYRQAEEQALAAQTLEEHRDQLQSQALEMEMQARQLQEQSTELEARNEALDRARAEAERGRAEAEQANRSKTDFLSMMSHELRTPLNAIAGHAQLIEMGIHGPVTSAQHEAMGRLRRSQRHLLHLVDDLLNLARIESGRVEYELEDLELHDVLHDATPMVEPQLAAKRIAFGIDVPADCVVHADREKLQQILINLLGNASKFTPAEGQVTVDCSTRHGAPPGVVFLRVRDTGPGIPASKQDSIFEPFMQVDGQRTPDAQTGVGLGLAIARDLARGMGGDLRVRSAEGQGSVFTLTLPRSAAAGA
jgi:signal transduction histidine kinase